MAKEENNLKVVKVVAETAGDISKEAVKGHYQEKKVEVDNKTKENLEKIKIDGEIQKKALDGINDPEWKKQFLIKKHEDEVALRKREQNIKIGKDVVIYGGLGFIGFLIFKIIEVKCKNNNDNSNNMFIDGNNVIEIKEENDNK